MLIGDHGEGASELYSSLLDLAPGAAAAVTAKEVPKMVAANDTSRPVSRIIVITKEAKADPHAYFAVYCWPQYLDAKG